MRKTIFIVEIVVDHCVEVYYCEDEKAVKETVFEIFTDFDPNEDTVEEIDEHLCENDAGRIDIREVELIVACK